MNSAAELLALRKQVLVARSAMLRLRAARDVQALRESLACPRVAASIAGSAPGRSALFGALLLLAGGRRLARFVRLTAVAVTVARVAWVVARRVAQPRATSAASSQLPDASS